jgi:hypothetical protein
MQGIYGDTGCPNCDGLPYEKFPGGVNGSWKSYVGKLCYDHKIKYLDNTNGVLARAQQGGWKQYFVDCLLQRVAFLEENINNDRGKTTTKPKIEPETRPTPAAPKILGVEQKEKETTKYFMGPKGYTVATTELEEQDEAVRYSDEGEEDDENDKDYDPFEGLKTNIQRIEDAYDSDRELVNIDTRLQNLICMYHALILFDCI